MRQPQRAFESVLKEPIVELSPVTGGDICRAYRLRTADGRTLFGKTRADAPADFFAAEAHGLQWLRERSPLRIPKVVAVGSDPVACLLLEYLPSGPRRADFDRELGRGLALLHRSAVEGFGLERDNYIGTLEQPNGPCSTWAEFYLERRLRPLFERAEQSGRGPDGWARRLARLAERLPALLPNEEPPSPLHGDLWAGNLHVGPAGEPCLIDPAVYAGHREVDLAMMRLFGGFGPEVFRAYEHTYPLQPGAQERLPLYQLTPLLTHLNLFGSSYTASVDRALRALGV